MLIFFLYFWCPVCLHVATIAASGALLHSKFIQKYWYSNQVRQLIIHFLIKRRENVSKGR